MKSNETTRRSSMWTVTDAYNTVYSPNYFSFFFLKAKKTYVNEVKHAKKLNNENKKKQQKCCVYHRVR